MTVGKLDRDKLVMVARLTRRAERFVPNRVVAGALRSVVGPISDHPAAFNVQAKLKTARTETDSPVERTLGPEIVPLQTDAEPVEVAPEWAPALRHVAPGDRFVIADHLRRTLRARWARMQVGFHFQKIGAIPVPKRAGGVVGAVREIQESRIGRRR